MKDFAVYELAAFTCICLPILNDKQGPDLPEHLLNTIRLEPKQTRPS